MLDRLSLHRRRGRACSHVLLAMGADEDRARGSLRFSLGYTTTQSGRGTPSARRRSATAVTRARRAASASRRVRPAPRRLLDVPPPRRVPRPPSFAPRLRLRSHRPDTLIGLLCSTGPEPFWPDVPPAQLYWPDVPPGQKRSGPMFHRPITCMAARAWRNCQGADNLKELWGFGCLPPCRAALTPLPRRLARVDAGHEVTGVHLALSANPSSYRTGARGCCTLEDARDARRAADVIVVSRSMSGTWPSASPATWWTTS